MNPYLVRSSKLLIPLASAVFLLVSVCAAKAQILLTINDSDPNAVVITATGEIPTNSVSDLLNNGVDLLGFFTGPIANIETTFDVLPGSTLTTTANAGSGAYFDSAELDNLSNSNVDLSLFSSNQSATEVFTANPDGMTAFTGTMTIDLNAYASLLPTLTTDGSGIIKTSYTLSPPNVEIGSWQVVTAPEPSTWVLLLVGFGLVTYWRARRGGFRS